MPWLPVSTPPIAAVAAGFFPSTQAVRRPLRGSAFRTAASVPFSRFTRCCRKVWAGPLFLHIPERADKIGERLPIDTRERIGELFIPRPLPGRPPPLPTPPGSRFTAHAPVVRVHPVDRGCGSRIFPKTRKRFRRPLRGSAYRTAAGVPFSRVTRCCRKVWAGPLFLHIPERADKIGERLPIDARGRIGELFLGPGKFHAAVFGIAVQQL